MATIVLPSPPPDASATVKGLVNLTAQTFAGLKTFSGGISTGSLAGLSSLAIGTTVISGGSVDVSPAGPLSIGQTASTINIGDPNIVATSTVNITGTTYINHVTPIAYFHQGPSSVGSPLINSSLLNLRMGYYNVSPQVYDIGIQGVIDSVTPTAHLLFQFNGGARANLDNTGRLTLTDGSTSTAFYASSSQAVWTTGGLGLILSSSAVSPYSDHSSSDNILSLGSASSRWSKVYAFGISDGQNASLTLNESLGSELAYAGNAVLLNAADIVVSLGGTGNLLMSPNKQFGVTAQAATNTTAMTLAPNVADGATSIGLVINNVTALATGKMVSLQNGGSEKLYFGYATAVAMGTIGAPGSFALQPGGVNSFYVTSTQFASAGTQTLGSVSNIWPNVFSAAYTNIANNLLTAQTIGTSLQNNTLAAAITPQQYSPMLELLGQAWNTTTPISKTNKVAFQLIPGTAATTTSRLGLYIASDGAAYGATPNLIFDNPVGGASARIMTSSGALYLDGGGNSAVVLGYFEGAGGVSFDMTNASPNNDNVIALGGAGGRHWTNVYSYAYTLKPGGSISSTAAGATNTTAMTITPNVVDGASSIGLLIQSGTHLLNGILMRISDITTGALFDFKMDGVGNPVIKNGQINSFFTLSNNPTINSASGAVILAGLSTGSLGLLLEDGTNTVGLGPQSGNQMFITANSIYPTTAGATIGRSNTPWYQLFLLAPSAGTALDVTANATNTNALAKFKDNNGNLRAGYDTQGLPSLGSYHYKAEDFSGVSTSYTTSGFVGNTGWSALVSGGGLGVKYLANTGGASDTTSSIGGGAYCDPSSTGGGTVFFFYAGDYMIQNNTSHVAVWEWSTMFPAQTNNVQSFMGIYSSNQFAHPQGFGFWWTGTGNWQWFTDNGTTRTINALTVPTAPTANRFQRFRIEFYGLATPVGVAAGNVNVVKLYINGTLVQAFSGTNVYINPTGQVFGIGNNCLTTAGAPYLVVAAHSQWYTTVTSPFSP